MACDSEERVLFVREGQVSAQSLFLSSRVRPEMRTIDVSFGELDNDKSFDYERYCSESEEFGSSRRREERIKKQGPFSHIELERIRREVKVSDFDAECSILPPQNHYIDGAPSFIEQESLANLIGVENFNLAHIAAVLGDHNNTKSRILSPTNLNASAALNSKSGQTSNVSSTKNNGQTPNDKIKRFFQSKNHPNYMFPVRETESNLPTKREESTERISARPNEHTVDRAILRGLAKLMIAERKQASLDLMTNHKVLKNENLPTPVKVPILATHRRSSTKNFGKQNKTLQWNV